MKREINMIKLGVEKKTKEAKEEPKKSTIDTDPNGMYTGVPTQFPYEMPVQDVDDL